MKRTVGGTPGANGAQDRRMGGAKRNPSVLFVAGRSKELFVTEAGRGQARERTGHSPVKERKALLDGIDRERRRISPY